MKKIWRYEEQPHESRCFVIGKGGVIIGSIGSGLYSSVPHTNAVSYSKLICSAPDMLELIRKLAEGIPQGWGYGCPDQSLAKEAKKILRRLEGEYYRRR